MTNYEKYKEIIDTLWEQNFEVSLNKNTNEVFPCSELDCIDCAFSSQYCDGVGCGISQSKWLVAEYKDFKFDWSDVPIDTRILVRNRSEDNWVKRHFAGVSDLGVVMAWEIGCTSWTNGISPVLWKYAKLAEVK